MKRELTSVYRCPATAEPLSLIDEVLDGDEVLAGFLVSPSGTRYPINDSVPDLVWPQQLSGADNDVRLFYDARADVYDQYLPLTFATFRESEAEIRREMVDLLL